MSNSSVGIPLWVPVLLRVAAVYNLSWGAFIVLLPRMPFAWLGIEPINYPSIFQCLGMVIGVYGIGYWIAARDAERHWPIVLVGLLGKLFGPIGFVYVAFCGELPWSMIWTVITNDLIWWVPFSAILIHVARLHEAWQATSDGWTLERALQSAVTSNGKSLFDQSLQSPLLLVCVRHFGCAFCRETLADLSNQMSEVNRAGLTPIIISMSTNEQASRVLAQHQLSHVAHMSDPQRRLYRALDLPFGSLGQVVGWNAIKRAVFEGVVFRFGFGKIVGSALQLSGAFVVKNGRVVQAIRHTTSAERTDFAKLSCNLT